MQIYSIIRYIAIVQLWLMVMSSSRNTSEESKKCKTPGNLDVFRKMKEIKMKSWRISQKKGSYSNLFQWMREHLYVNTWMPVDSC